MSTRTVLLASVCSVFLAASAAVAGPAAATPASSTKLVSVAYKALQGGDATGAVQSYTQAIESRQLEPEVLANALLNRGLAWQRLNEHERAIDDYTAAMRLDAMSGKLRALALYNRGLSYQKTGKASRAIEDYTSALFLDSQFAHAYYSRGTLLRDSGQHLFALADFDKALRFNHPDPARVYFAEALTYEKLRRPQNARDALTQALAANPSYEPARARLAVLDGSALAVVSAPADGMATATIADAAAHATALPEAAAPPAKLVAATQAGSEQPQVLQASTSAKKIDDRVPDEAVVAETPAPEEPQEKIVAVERCPTRPPTTAPWRKPPHPRSLAGACRSHRPQPRMPHGRRGRKCKPATGRWPARLRWWSKPILARRASSTGCGSSDLKVRVTPVPPARSSNPAA